MRFHFDKGIGLSNNQGIVLVASIMLIVFASIIVLSTSTFIVQRLIAVDAKENQLMDLNLAHAGIQQAVYFYRFRDISANGYFTLGQTNVNATDYFVLGGAAGDLLMVNTATAALSGTGIDLQNLRIQNATNTKTITIDRMIVSWNNTRLLQNIRINGSSVWTGNLASPANANITNFTLNTTPTIYNINRLRFNGSMAGATISIQFVMTDGTIRNLQVYPASNNFNFTVKSTGKTTGSNIYRTLQADYNALTGKIINYNEINTQITP